MGAYLTTPKTDKICQDESSERFDFGAASMQGWRISQEDAHNAILNYDEETLSSFFAVYDGHGGGEVAAYCAQRLPRFIRESEEFKKGLYSKALENSFIKFDETLTDRSVVAALKKLTGEDDDEDDEEETLNEVDNLCQEATMPIEDVIAKYEDKENGEEEEEEVPKNIVNKALNGVKAGCSSSKKPISPFLRGKKGQEGCSSGANNKHIRFNEDGEEVEDKNGDKKDNVETEIKDEIKKDEIKSENDVKEESANNNGTEVKSERNGETCEKENTAVNGREETEDEPVKTIVKGKGKGKGKGKSNQIAPKPRPADHDDDDDEEVTVKEKRPKKTAEEIYHTMLNEDEEEDSDDEEDEDAFADKDSSDDDEEEEDLEEEEPDTEDEEDECEENEFVGGDSFNEEPGNDSGCTSVVALVVAGELYVANAGDSRCVVCRNGEAVEMSFDHKPEDKPEQDRIEKAGGTVTQDGRVNGGLNLSRALGDHAYKTNANLPLTEQMISPQPDIRSLKLDPATDSFIVLACDGIWNSMTSQEVVDYIKPRLEKNPQKISSICEELFDECLAPDTKGDGTGCDNMTAVIVRIKDAVANKTTLKRTLNGEDVSTEDATPKDEQPLCKKSKIESEEEAQTSS